MHDPRRLLAVDDDPAILRLIEHVAGGLGFAVETVADGGAFKASYLRVQPDVVTLDIFMPEVDGIELIRWLISIEAKARVIIISGSSGLFTELGERLATARGSLRIAKLPKPFRVEELRDVLRDTG